MKYKIYFEISSLSRGSETHPQQMSIFLNSAQRADTTNQLFSFCLVDEKNINDYLLY